MKIVYGAVIEFDVTTEDNASAYANSKQITCGEVMVAGKNFGVSVTENVASPED